MKIGKIVEVSGAAVEGLRFKDGKKQYLEEAMLPEEQAVTRLSAELAKIYLENVGKEADPELVREEAAALVAQYGPITTIKEIFTKD